MRPIAPTLALVVTAAIQAQTVDRPLEVGGEVKPPIAIETPGPKTTEAMIKERTSCVGVALIVDEHGSPQNLHLTHSSGSTGLDQAILKAMAGYRFKPATLRGAPVAVKLNMESCVD